MRYVHEYVSCVRRESVTHPRFFSLNISRRRNVRGRQFRGSRQGTLGLFQGTHNKVDDEPWQIDVDSRENKKSCSIIRWSCRISIGFSCFFVFVPSNVMAENRIDSSWRELPIDIYFWLFLFSVFFHSLSWDIKGRQTCTIKEETNEKIVFFFTRPLPPSCILCDVPLS